MSLSKEQLDVIEQALVAIKAVVPEFDLERTLFSSNSEKFVIEIPVGAYVTR